MLFELLEKEAPRSSVRIAVMAGITGFANAAILAVVQTAAEGGGNADWGLFLFFLGAALAYVVGLRQSVSLLSQNLESALCRLRIELADRIRNSELLGLEHIGSSEIYERLTEQTSLISSAAWPLALGMQSVVMVVCSVLYLSFVSTQMLVLTLVVYGLGALYYAARHAHIQQLLQEAASTRMRLFERLIDFLDGFKEVRLRTRRSEDLHAEFQHVAGALKRSAMQTNLLNMENLVFATLMQFVLLGTAAFVLPQFVEVGTHTTIQSISVLVFIFGPLGQIIYTVPEYHKANLAAQNILQLHERLAVSATPTVQTPSAWAGQPFAELRVEQLEFRRLDAQGHEMFAVGPVNLTLRAGEILFLVGGNGSGKTTLLRALTALYAPTAGDLYVNGVALGPHNRQAYRELLAAIFGDFHLFRTLYGLSGVSGEQVQALLTQMHLAEKTQLVEGQWTTIDLSTGQRKRMAMVVALLEDRPIYVFDEWAADQDPAFRQYFYEELLPDLKKRGKAVIAISHDDRFFHCADQVLTLEYGKVRSIGAPGKC